MEIAFIVSKVVERKHDQVTVFDLSLLPFHANANPLWLSYSLSAISIWGLRLFMFMNKLPLMERQHKWFYRQFLSSNCPICWMMGQRDVSETLDHFLSCPNSSDQRREVLEESIIPCLQSIVGVAESEEWIRGIPMFDLENHRVVNGDGSPFFWRCCDSGNELVARTAFYKLSRISSLDFMKGLVPSCLVDSLV